MLNLEKYADVLKKVNDVLLKIGIIPLWLIVLVLDFLIIKFVFLKLMNKQDKTIDMDVKGIWCFLCIVAADFATFIFFFMAYYSLKKRIEIGIEGGFCWCVVVTFILGFFLYIQFVPGFNDDQKNPNEKSDSKDIARPEDLKQVQTDAPRIEQKLKWYDKFELWENLITDKFLEFFELEDQKYRPLREKKFIVASSISVLLVTLPFFPFMLIGKYLFDSDVPYIQWFVSGVICKLFKINPEIDAAKNPEKFEKRRKRKAAVRNIIRRIVYGFLGLLCAGIMSLALFVSFKGVKMIVVNICACCSKQQYHGKVLENKYSRYGRGTHSICATVEFEADGKIYTYHIEYDSANPINDITGIDKKNKKGDDVIVCVTKHYVILKNTVINSILNNLFLFICFLVLAVPFGIGVYFCGAKVIKGPDKEVPLD